MILISIWSAKGEGSEQGFGSESWRRWEIKGIYARTLRECSFDGHKAARGIV